MYKVCNTYQLYISIYVYRVLLSVSDYILNHTHSFRATILLAADTLSLKAVCIQSTATEVTGATTVKAGYDDTLSWKFDTLSYEKFFYMG